MVLGPSNIASRRGLRRLGALACGCALLAVAAASAIAQDGPAAGPAVTTAAASQSGAAGSASRRQQSAYKRVSDAAGVVDGMGKDAGMGEVLGRALGIYIVPSYGRAALGVGAAGGSGVLVLKRADGNWGNPAFFNIGALTVGLQAGAEGGPIALLLMNPKAVDSFRKKNNFSLSADAGLTVVNFARTARGSSGGDVVAWSGNKGLFGNVVTVGVNDIRYNQRLTDAYYGKSTTATQAIDGTAPSPQADALRKALSNPPTSAGGASK